MMVVSADLWSPALALRDRDGPERQTKYILV
jgi:hypothetical protein